MINSDHREHNHNITTRDTIANLIILVGGESVVGRCRMGLDKGEQSQLVTSHTTAATTTKTNSNRCSVMWLIDG